MLQLVLGASYLAAIGLSAYTACRLLGHAGKNRAAMQLAFCQLLVIPWCVPRLFLGLCMTAGTRFFAYCVSYLGICLIGPAWFHFAVLYCRRRPHAGVMPAACYALGILFYAALLTNSRHHLFYRSFEAARVAYGPLFYANMAFVYACVSGGMGELAVRFRREQTVPRHWEVLILAAALPLAINFLYMNGILHTGLDLTAPAFSVSSLFLFLAIFRYDLLDVNTQAMEQIFEEIAEGVVIYNRRSVVTYVNAAARRFFDVAEGSPAKPVLERFFSAPAPDEPFLGDASAGGGLPAAKARVVAAGMDGAHLDLRRYETRAADGSFLSGTVLITDVSPYFELLERERELSETNRRLAVERERNRIAQDVHDTTGHTLTMISSLLKLMEVEWKKREDGAPAGAWPGEPEAGDTGFEAYLAQARSLASGGLRELRCSINELRRPGDETVTQAVFRLAESVREMKVEVQVQGDDGPAYTHLTPVVSGCLREAVTNCLRYAEASHMDVILRFLPRQLSLYIFDNGKGCGEIREGNGLRGIRERARLAGGEARVVSAPGEGFQIVLQLPVASGQ